MGASEQQDGKEVWGSGSTERMNENASIKPIASYDN